VEVNVLVKAYEEVEVQPTYFNSALDRGEQSASRFGLFISGEVATVTLG